MDVQLAEKQVETWAKASARSLGFKGAKIEAKYIWNPGGFVNQSYRLSDGETVRHLKLAQEYRAPLLQQWARLSGYLTSHYHAPRLFEEVTQEIIPGYSYGLVFDYIQGTPLSSCSDPTAVVENVLKALNRLHADQEFKKGVEAHTRSYSEAFAEEYIVRFEEDLETIRSERHLLDFVSDDALDWFDSEVRTLKRLVYQLPSFQMKARDTVHNDLNWHNVLVEGDGSYWIIDWDDLTVNGDAAMDYSVFLWPLHRSKDWPFWEKRLRDLEGGEPFERMEVYFRAKLLDDVIDVLADYIEAEKLPEVKERTQQEAKETHLRAYPEYLGRYAKVPGKLQG
ncbi:aminoglycoside phosphotransferase family protein [Paenibacillus sp. MZ04-78.2]|uniref:phosphotransferase family protein n=1 Tax=Paenibacillus sp. MZ04-78.2 TaxID=2962034 RepID=UPI0020B6BDB1|nr:aminoglycoside phosphotransferase family protein [Paenibacillus sp. MZ04-78.2]